MGVSRDLRHRPLSLSHIYQRPFSQRTKSPSSTHIGPVRRRQPDGISTRHFLPLVSDDEGGPSLWVQVTHTPDSRNMGTFYGGTQEKFSFLTEKKIRGEGPDTLSRTPITSRVCVTFFRRETPKVSVKTPGNTNHVSTPDGHKRDDLTS